MGKVKNAKRNPGITWADLKYVVHGERIVTHGEEYAVVGVGGLGQEYRLVSPNGIRYAMYVRPNGVVEAPEMTL